MDQAAAEASTSSSAIPSSAWPRACASTGSRTSEVEALRAAAGTRSSAGPAGRRRLRRRIRRRSCDGVYATKLT